MRVYIGVFDESRANVLADVLRKAGIKSELRHALDVDIEEKYYIKGKLSELKNKYKENKEIGKIIEDIAGYIEKARQVIKDGIEEREFEESFLNLAFPERKNYEEISKEMKKRLKDVVNLNEIYDKLVEKFGKEKVNEFLDKFQDELNLMSLVHQILESNGIKYEDGKMYGTISDDPEIKIYLKGGRKEGLEYETKSWVSKRVDIYANLMDAVYEIGKLDKLVDKNPELMPLLFMADVIAKIIDKIENKMPLEELEKKISIMKDDRGEIRMERDAINEIIKTLEKGDIIKIKNGKIILKEKRKR